MNDNLKVERVAHDIAVRMRADQGLSVGTISKQYGLGSNLANVAATAAKEKHSTWMMGHFAKPVRVEDCCE